MQEQRGEASAMRLSQYFLPVLRENPSEAAIVSHRLMLRAGMIRQAASGIYSWLPLGLRVLRKVERIVDEEQQRAGAIPLLMPTVQPADLWRQSGRYDDYGEEMLRIRDRHGRDMLYGPTNEEMITEIFRGAVTSYRDFPKILYHIQWKFRDEVRPRFGVMRGREFLMKDAYSFDLDRPGAETAYHRMFVSYLRTFRRLGLVAVPMRADSGPIGGDLTHEFLILADTGESEVFLDRRILDADLGDDQVRYDDPASLRSAFETWTGRYARTDETHDPERFEAEVPAEWRTSGRGIEVGHVFHFGDKYSRAMGASIRNADGTEVFCQMGSYGVGVSRLVGAMIEASHDERGIVWPGAVAPFDCGLVNLKQGDAAVDGACEAFLEAARNAGIDVLYDDTDVRPGQKFARMELIGLPWRVDVGPRDARTGEVELVCRRSGEKRTLAAAVAVAELSGRNAGS